MSKIKEIIVASVLPAFREIGKIEMKQVLADMKKNKDEETYRNLLNALHANFSLLQQAALTTTTKIDDGIVGIILEAVKETAAADNIGVS